MENRTPLKARVHSPAPCLLTPNDDDRERAQLRLARAAALRRKSGLAPDVEERLSTTRQQESNVLSKERILELHNNCIKLAAENVRLAFTGVLFSTLFSPFCLSLCDCGC
jgi:condensin complex subunit 2